MANHIFFIQADKVALVFQQYAVLESNLDSPVEKFYGSTVRNAGKGFWEEQFSHNMVIVCTAEILYSCLQHSFIRMSQINILIFDEAHHAKGEHPYARIMKHFYMQGTDKESRPRIFGMTASPLDGLRDVEVAAAELEGLLHSEIVTVSDPSTLQRTICKPKEEREVVYQRLCNPMAPKLLQKLIYIVGFNKQLFEKPFDYAKSAFSQLGPWCADRFCQRLFREEEIQVLQGRTERNFEKGLHWAPDRDAWVRGIREAGDLVNSWPSEAARNDPDHLSSKVRALLAILSENFSSPARSMKCIVFVQERNTAELLADLLVQPNIRIPALMPAPLVSYLTSSIEGR